MPAHQVPVEVIEEIVDPSDPWDVMDYTALQQDQTNEMIEALQARVLNMEGAISEILGHLRQGKWIMLSGCCARLVTLMPSLKTTQLPKLISVPTHQITYTTSSINLFNSSPANWSPFHNHVPRKARQFKSWKSFVDLRVSSPSKSITWGIKGLGMVFKRVTLQLNPAEPFFLPS